MDQWKKRKLVGKHYVYFWVEEIYCNVRMDEKQCLLVIIGVTESGKKELVAIENGFIESELSWMSVLRDLKERGLVEGPRLAIGDTAPGFWKAMAQIYPETQSQCCWLNKTANVLSNLPKSLQNKAKEHLRQIWMASGIEEAEKNFDVFMDLYGAEYPKATECLDKDRDKLLNFYSYPPEHWKNIRTSNPLESTSARERLRTAISETGKRLMSKTREDLQKSKEPVSNSSSVPLLPSLSKEFETRIKANMHELSMIEGTILGENKNIKTIYITSCVNHEGKTTAAVSMAHALRVITESCV